MDKFKDFLDQCREFLDCNNQEDSLNVSFPIPEQDLEKHIDFLTQEFKKGTSPFNALFSLYIERYRGSK